MSLTKVDFLEIDHPGAASRTLELWTGDLLSDNSIPKSDFLVITDTGSSPSCAGSLARSLTNKGANPSSLEIASDYRPAMPTYITDPLPLSASLAYERLLIFNPSHPKLNEREVAPYQLEDIFRSLHCFKKGKDTTVTIPMVMCGSALDGGQLSPYLIMRMLFHAACQWGGFEDSGLTTVRLVMHRNSGGLAAHFALLKWRYLNLTNTNDFPYLPFSYQSPYPFHAQRSLKWINGLKAKPWPDPVTDLQAFGINLYTGNYFHAINDTLRKTDDNLPKINGVGWTDLNNPDFQEIQPIYAIIGAGLMNIPVQSGPVDRGVTPSYSDGNYHLWNPFKVGSDVKILSYLSGSRPQGTVHHDVTFTIQAHTAASISYYSFHPSENEHLFDHGFQQHVDSNNFSPTYGSGTLGTTEVGHPFCTAGH